MTVIRSIRVPRELRSRSLRKSCNMEKIITLLIPLFLASTASANDDVGNTAILENARNDIINGSILDNWGFYLASLSISFIGAVLGTWIKEAIKQNLINKNYENVLTRLNNTEKSLEKIRLKSWDEREIKSLRREKLEDYLNLINEEGEKTYSFYEEVSSSEIGEKVKGMRGDKESLRKAKTLQSLYFPELEKEHSDLEAVYAELFRTFQNIMQIRKKWARELKKPMDNIEDFQVVKLTAEGELNKIFNKHNEVRDNLLKAMNNIWTKVHYDMASEIGYKKDIS